MKTLFDVLVNFQDEAIELIESGPFTVKELEAVKRLVDAALMDVYEIQGVVKHK